MDVIWGGGLFTHTFANVSLLCSTTLVYVKVFFVGNKYAFDILVFTVIFAYFAMSRKCETD